MKRCPFDGCTERVYDTEVCCRKHWHEIPIQHQSELQRMRMNYYRGCLGLVERVTRQKEIVAAVQAGINARSTA